MIISGLRIKPLTFVLSSALFGLFATAALAESTNDGATPETLDEAWWTGPMLANSAKPLPTGHFLVESYLFDDIQAGSNSYRSLNYLLYGLTDRVTIGVIPTGGVNQASSMHSVIGITDTTLQAQYGLTSFDGNSGTPDISIALRETLPTGKYDRLSGETSAFGSGVYTTTVAVFSQDYIWLPNNRIMRIRLDLYESFSGSAHVEDASVYGTNTGFSGNVKPGNNFLADTSFEYSLSQKWVLALDLLYSLSGSTNLRDIEGNRAIRRELGESEWFGYAPAIEYSWSPNIGLLLGVRIIPSGRNTPASATPAVALNYVI